MARLSILAVYLISALAINFVECSTLPETSEFKIRADENMDGGNVFDGVTPKSFSKHNTFGGHVPSENVLAIFYNERQWPIPGDFSHNLKYYSADDRYISYVEVDVEQSSDLGNAFIQYGGIGKKFIEFSVKAQNTTYFNYKVIIYGYH